MHIEIQNCFSFWGTSSPDPPDRGFAPGLHWGTCTPDSFTGRPPHFVPGLRPCAEASRSTPSGSRTNEYDYRRKNCFCNMAALNWCWLSIQLSSSDSVCWITRNVWSFVEKYSACVTSSMLHWSETWPTSEEGVNFRVFFLDEHGWPKIPDNLSNVPTSRPIQVFKNNL